MLNKWENKMLVKMSIKQSNAVNETIYFKVQLNIISLMLETCLQNGIIALPYCTGLRFPITMDLSLKSNVND